MTGRDASGVYGIQMFSVRREQGRLAELAPVIRVLASGDGPAGAWRPGLAVVLSELGMEDEARRELGRIREAGLETLRSACGSARSRTSPTRAPRSATRPRRRSSTRSSALAAGRT